MALGFLDQYDHWHTVSFIENVLPNLTKGVPLAESMINHYYMGDDQLIVGYPTFCFIPEEHKEIPATITPGFELLSILLAIALVLFWKRKRRV